MGYGIPVKDKVIIGILDNIVFFLKRHFQMLSIERIMLLYI
jgi:hypothetical protein